MPNLTYKVVPAPSKGRRGQGAKGTEGRFANAMEMLLNEMAAEGWSYVRAETLPSNDRSGMTRRVVETYQNVLVFSKVAEAVDAVSAPVVVAPIIPPIAPLPAEPAMSEPVPDPEPEVVAESGVESGAKSDAESDAESVVEDTRD